MSKDVLAKLTKASKDLLYPSESDAPFEPIRCEGEPTPETLAVQSTNAKPGRKSRKRAFQEISLSDFFSELNDTEEAARFQDLESVLRNNLTDIKVFRV